MRTVCLPHGAAYSNNLAPRRHIIEATLSTTAPWPEDLFEFARLPDRDERLQEFADFAEREGWAYRHTENGYQFPILFNYLQYTYRPVAAENKTALSEDGQYCRFNTDLATLNQEAFFALF